jgi:hypothetical protein
MMETPSTYWDHAGQELTKAEYDTLVSAGKRFALKACKTKMSDGACSFHQKYKQLTPADQTALEGRETVILAAQPWLTDVGEMKAFMLRILEKKVEGRYKKYIDSHHAKKTRIDRRGGSSHTLPTAVTDYEDALESAWTAIQSEVNAKTTIPDINAYVVGKNGNTAWPDDSAVKNL